MIKRFIVAAVVLTLVFGGVIGFKLYQQAATREYLENRGIPAVHVNGVRARLETWDQQLAAIGSLRARHGIDIRSEVDGVIERVHVESGQRIGKGELIVALDDTVDQAILKSARARMEKARRDFERDRSLFERGLLSEDNFDSTQSEFKSAEALVEETQGIIDKKTIRAPFAGTVGIHNLSEGHYLEPGDEVVSLQALDKLYLDLNLPEKELERIKAGQRVTFTVPSRGNRTFEGEVRFVDALIQTATRNVLVRALVENPEQALLPGMFANATIILDEAQEVVVVPREAVAFSLYGETVYLLENTGAGGGKQGRYVARRHVVKSDEVRGDHVSLEGLAPGDAIALDTQHRLLDGTPVVIENFDAMGAGSGAESE